MQVRGGRQASGLGSWVRASRGTDQNQRGLAVLTLQLSIVLLLILVNGFFAMAEIALVSARPARLQPLAAAGNRGAEAALELKGDPSRLLATVQIGITIIAVLSGTFGQATLGESLQDFLTDEGGVIAPYAHAI